MTLPDWVLPVIGGVVGAATPGLGRGVSLAANIADQIDAKKRRDEAYKAAAQLAGLFQPTAQQQPTNPGESMANLQQLEDAVNAFGTVNPYYPVVANAALQSVTSQPQPQVDRSALASQYIGDVAQINPYLAAQMWPSLYNSTQPQPTPPEKPVKIYNNQTRQYELVPASQAVGRPVSPPEKQTTTTKTPKLYPAVDENGVLRYYTAQEAIHKRVPNRSRGRTTSSRTAKAQKSNKVPKKSPIKKPIISASQAASLLNRTEKQMDALSGQIANARVAGNPEEEARLQGQMNRLKQQADKLKGIMDTYLGVTSEPPKKKDVKIIKFDSQGRRIQ